VINNWPEKSYIGITFAFEPNSQLSRLEAGAFSGSGLTSIHLCFRYGYRCIVLFKLQVTFVDHI
jgi:hypothetical protein